MKESALEFNNLKLKVETLQTQHESLVVQKEQGEDVVEQVGKLTTDIAQAMDEVEKYEVALGLSDDDPHVAEIENDLRENLREIENKIKKISGENGKEAISELTPEQENALIEIMEAEEKIRMLSQEMKELGSKNAEMHPEDFKLRMQALEIEMLQTRGAIHKFEKNLGVDRNDAEIKQAEQEIRSRPQEQGKIAAYSESEKQFDQKLDKAIDFLNTVNVQLKEHGHTMDTIHNLENSDNPQDQEFFRSLVQQFESRNIDAELDFLTRENPNKFMDSLSRLHDPAMRADFLRQFLDKTSIYIPKLVESMIQNVPRESEEFKRLQKNINGKINEEQLKLERTTLEKLSAEETLDKFLQNPELCDSTQRELFFSKASDLFETSVQNNDVATIQNFYTKLSTWSGGQDNIPRNCFPKALREVLFSNADMFRVLSGGMVSEDYEHYARNLGNDEIYKKLIPEIFIKQAEVSKYIKNLQGPLDVDKFQTFLGERGLSFLDINEDVRSRAFDLLIRENKGSVNELFGKLGIVFSELPPDDKFFIIEKNPIERGVLLSQCSLEDFSYILQNGSSWIFFEEIPEKYRQYLKEDIQEYVHRNVDNIYNKKEIGYFEYFSEENFKYILQFAREIKLSEIPEQYRESLKEDIKKYIQRNAVKIILENHTDFLEMFSVDDYKIAIEASYSYSIYSSHVPEKYRKELEPVFFKKITSEIDASPDSSSILNVLRQEVFMRDQIFDYLQNKVNADENEKQENKEIKIRRLQNIQESFWISDNEEKLPIEVREVLEQFKNEFGNKGKNIVALAIAAYGIEDPKIFKEKMQEIREIINKYNPENIPDGAHVSMGIEYEATDSISNEYSKESALGYRRDALLVSQSANLGIGGGGVNAAHEFFTKPTYNPYLLLVETKLLQDAGFFDLNFIKYPLASRGYHLSLVGDSGLLPNKNMYFLHNVMTMAQLAGITAGEDNRSTKGIYNKEYEVISDRKQSGARCEIKGMATDSIEQYEKTIVTAHHAGIAIQLCQKYLNKDIEQLENIPDSAQEFEKMLIDTGSLAMPFNTDQERDIVFEWMKFQGDIVIAVEQQNESFIDTEFHGSFIDKKGNYDDSMSEKVLARENAQRLVTENMTEEELHRSVSIDTSYLFQNQQTGLVNALTHLNNFFLLKAVRPSEGQYLRIKQPDGTETKMINLSNINGLWNMNDEGYQARDKDPLGDNQTKSIVDNGGVLRDGYYRVGGVSEEMIIHKSQILLNRFNKRMQGLLKTPGVKREIINSGTLVSA